MLDGNVNKKPSHDLALKQQTAMQNYNPRVKREQAHHEHVSSCKVYLNLRNLSP